MTSIKLPETTESKLLIALMTMITMVQQLENFDLNNKLYYHAFDIMLDAQDKFILKAREAGLVEDVPTEGGINLPNITRKELEVMAAEKYLKETGRI